jgi:hypothetical protein
VKNIPSPSETEPFDYLIALKRRHLNRPRLGLRTQPLDFRLLPAFSGLFQPFQSQPSVTGLILMRAMKGDLVLT